MDCQGAFSVLEVKEGHHVKKVFLLSGQVIQRLLCQYFGFQLVSRLARQIQFLSPDRRSIKKFLTQHS